MTPRLLTIQQVADELQINYHTTLRHIRAGRLEAVRLGKRDYRVSREALDAFISGCKVGTKVGTQPAAMRTKIEQLPATLARRGRARRPVVTEEVPWYERFR